MPLGLIVTASMALGMLTRIVVELRRRRCHLPSVPDRAFSPPGPPGLDPGVAGLVEPTAEESRAMEWRLRTFSPVRAWPRVRMLRIYVCFTHGVDYPVGRLARVHGHSEPYTLREILSWPAISREDLESRLSDLRTSLDTPN